MAICGTGGFVGALPGDPSNALYLTATPVFEGILVAWTYPDLNPEAVAHVRLYRNTGPDFATAGLYRIVTGDSYRDDIHVSDLTEYFYWIEVVSVHGTVSDPIGPASATARPSINDLIIDLTGQIDAGLLATTLRTPIERIPTIENSIAQEALDRISDISVVGNLIDQAQADNSVTRGLIVDESNARIAADSAFVNTVNGAIVTMDDNLAAALTEYETAVDAQAARATLENTLTVNYEGHVATALLDYETFADAEISRASLKTVIQSEYETAFASALTDYETAADSEGARASMSTTIQSDYEGQIAALNQSLTTDIDVVDGKVIDIGALYTVQVDVNGQVGGFGIHNDGTTIEAGFDVDRFWVGKTNLNRKKPFIIDNGTVYIDQAMIQKANIFNLAIEGKVQSDNYIAGSTGFQIKRDGSFEMNQGVFRGAVEFTSSPNGQNNIDYNNLGGTKPPNDADKTSDHFGAKEISNYAEESDVTRLASVNGGVKSVASSSVSGAIKITLPQRRSNTMLQFWVDVFEYQNNGSAKSFSMQISGYINSSGWARYQAQIVGSTLADQTVRFAEDSTNAIVYIGETNTTWKYPKVVVRDVIVGHSNHAASQWLDGWQIGFATSFATVIGSLSNQLLDARAVKNQGALATKNSADYTNDISGTKPDADADKTGTHTAKDTSLVNGRSANTVKNEARSAVTKTNDWRRPGSTRINGNKIYTGDAYVDTLQIKGNAVIVPVHDEYTGTTITGNNNWKFWDPDGMPFVTATMDQAGRVLLNWTIHQKGQTSNPPKYSIGIHDYYSSSWVWQVLNVPTIDNFVSGTVSVPVSAGARGFALAWKGSNSAAKMYAATLTFTGMKR